MSRIYAHTLGSSLCALVLLVAPSAHATVPAGASVPGASVPAPGSAPSAALVEPLHIPLSVAPAPDQQYHLRMYHLHTHESLDVTYRVGDRYVPSALAMLNHFLRDHRTNDEASYDPHEFDVLHALMDKLGKPEGVIQIVCGYRTPWSNNYLREHGKGVAEHSQHMLSKAIDIRVPGVPTRTLQLAALSLGQGGVGYYPHSQFVHVDVGPVRQWTLM